MPVYDLVWPWKLLKVWHCKSCLNDPPCEEAVDMEVRKWYQLRKHCAFCGSPMDKTYLKVLGKIRKSRKNERGIREIELIEKGD